MSVILHIETATDVCSVAVSQDSAIIFQTDTLPHEGDSPQNEKGTNHGSVLGVMVDEAISFTDNHAIPFDAVAVSAGPGSYTGLRIGVSMAKGIAYGRELKLIAVPTLEVQCVPVLLVHDDLPEDALLCPMLDARRMEVYAALYTRALKAVMPTAPVVVDEHTFEKQLKEHPVYFFGNGAEKCKEVIRHPNAHFLDGVPLLAKYMSPLAEKKFLQGDFADVAYFEPNYLKEFQATVAKNPLESLPQGNEKAEDDE
ncbi:MAG: tRNA (adenosine(37)-N6)-threonylcarbamoyltransferase complex dimerization subunit type 1 TsaB [Bacteroidaceae bacterium]|nr:tRNA (adenosine(37)-N6)-threonylcarbamoyltransferase complex dimerization subunit type 1 TsaB [Bacteroidaceae bacterium]